MEDNKDVVKTEETVEEETTKKTYTEQDIQNSFNAGVKKANSEWQKDEKYKEFLDWKKNNQNDREKISQFFGEVVIKKVQSSPTLNGGAKETTTNDIMNNILRSGRN